MFKENDKDIQKKDKEGVTLDSTTIETTQNKVEGPTKPFTHEINGVMVSDEEWQNHLEQGKDAE
jgi:hypothetical protein